MVRTRSASRALWRWPNTSGRNGRRSIYQRESVGMSGGHQRPYAFVRIRAGVCAGGVALAQQQPAHATRLFGASQALLSATDWRLTPKDKTEYERNVATARAQLGDERFSAAWAAGQAMSLEEVMALAEERDNDG
jgi:hypothetical protein